MDTIETFQGLWFVLIFLLLAGYSLLDGFDLGVGALLPVLGRSAEDKDTLIASIGPVWDGNEVWLITAGGALFAAFPHAYATAFSGFYPAMMLVLFALIFRAVSMEFRALDPSRAGWWEKALICGSLGAAFLFGVALGNIIYGVPLDEHMEYAGDFITLLRPVPLLFGITGLFAVLLQGAAWAILKTDGALRDRAYRVAFVLLWGNVIASLAYFAVLAFTFSELAGRPLFYIAVGVSLVGWMGLHLSLRSRRDGRPLAASSLSFLGLWLAAGAAQFPHLIRASNVPDWGLTIFNSSTGLYTLQVMSVIGLAGMPVVIGYTIFVYRLFKGKAKADGHYDG